LVAASLGLTDAVKKFATQIDPSGKRRGTYKTGKEQIDYMLMSQDLATLARGAGVERREHFAPRTFTSFDTVASQRDQVSDHHCLWVDLTV
jgi:hypothetical protein